MDLFRAKLRGRVSLPLVGIGVQLADPISSDAMGTVVDFIWYDQVRVQEHSVCTACSLTSLEFTHRPRVAFLSNRVGVSVQMCL